MGPLVWFLEKCEFFRPHVTGAPLDRHGLGCFLAVEAHGHGVLSSSFSRPPTLAIGTFAFARGTLELLRVVAILDHHLSGAFRGRRFSSLTARGRGLGGAPHHRNANPGDVLKCATSAFVAGEQAQPEQAHRQKWHTTSDV